jgi:hypothetical protein
MFAKTSLFCLAFALLIPAVANADIYNKHSLKGKEVKSLRQAIAAKLNTMPASKTGGSKGAFLQSKIKGTYSTHVGFAGTSYSVTFQVPARQKIKVNGKTSTTYLGGCMGTCNVLRLPAGNYVSPQIQITGKLRSLAPTL